MGSRGTTAIRPAIALLLLAAACGGQAPPQPSAAVAPETDTAAPHEDLDPVATPEPVTEQVADPPSDETVDVSEAVPSATPGEEPEAAPEAPAETGSAEQAVEPAADPSASVPSPPPSGTYHYDTSGGAAGEMLGIRRSWQYDPHSTLVVEPRSGGKQRSVRDVSDSNGNGLVTEHFVEFTPDGVRLHAMHITTTFDAVTDQRQLQPDTVTIIQPTGQEPGDTTTFTMRGTGTVAEVTVDALRSEPMEVGSRTVTALLVRTDMTFTGEVEGRSVFETWYLPEHQLILAEQVVTDVQAGSDRLRSEFTAQLTDLEPTR
jgi:hypothetical protein